MKYLFLIVTISLISANTLAQNIPTLHAKIKSLLVFNLNEQKLIDRRDVLLKKEQLNESEQKELNDILIKYGEVVSDIWQADDGGCSWYCGGGPYKLIASSTLRTNGTIDYKVENIHDLSYKSAWAEGVDGHGINEYIEYHFKPNSPRITEIKIANGYVKTDKSWFENSRVKTLKMYVNNTPFAILELNDTKALQSFKLDKPLGRNNGDKDWVIKFEILDIYKGDNYDDVVISELFFDGIDVH